MNAPKHFLSDQESYDNDDDDHVALAAPAGHYPATPIEIDVDSASLAGTTAWPPVVDSGPGRSAPAVVVVAHNDADAAADEAAKAASRETRRLKRLRKRQRARDKKLAASSSALVSSSASVNFTPVVDAELNAELNAVDSGSSSEVTVDDAAGDVDGDASEASIDLVDDVPVPVAVTVVRPTSPKVDDDEPASLATNRYWMDPMASKACFNCGKRGHVREQCTAPSPCNFCGARTHSSRNCYTGACFNCYRPGHQRSNCPRQSSARDCSRCNARGHAEPECPLLWREYVYADAAASNSRGAGKRKQVRQYCFNCGERGHFGEECRQPMAYYSQKVFSSYQKSAFTVNGATDGGGGRVGSSSFGGRDTSRNSRRDYDRDDDDYRRRRHNYNDDDEPYRNDRNQRRSHFSRPSPRHDERSSVREISSTAHSSYARFQTPVAQFIPPQGRLASYQASFTGPRYQGGYTQPGRR